MSVSPAAPEASFWQWFAANAAHVATIRHGDEPIADELAAQLKKVDPDLTFEVSVSRVPRELIVSAGGLKRAFPGVKRLVAAAPPIKGWKVIAFRPRSTEGLIVEFGDYKVNPKEVWCATVRDGQKVGVTAYLPRYRDTNNVNQAAYLLLDGSLGEYDVETKVGFIELRPLPSDPASAGLRPLADLPGMVDRLVRSIK